MRTHLLAFSLFAVVCSGIVHADILANGNFNNGSAHWDGDRITNTDATDLVIPLKKDNWTKISQTFSTREKCLKLSVTFALSEDSTMLPKNSTIEFYLTDGVVKDVTGVQLQKTAEKMPRGGFVALIMDPMANMLDSFIMSSAPTTNSQPAQGFFYHLTPHEQKTFYLCFPPGNGTVTLTNVTLEPAPEGPANTQTAAQ